MLKKLSALALTLAAAVPAGQAHAEVPTRAAATSCSLQAGTFNAAGDFTYQSLLASNPPRAAAGTAATGIFPAGPVRLAGSFDTDNGDSDFPVARGGNAVVGARMYNVIYAVDNQAGTTQVLTRQLIGGGWDRMIAFEDSYPAIGGRQRFEYALRADGTLLRWLVTSDVHNQQTWTARGSVAGFAAVKTMTLISQKPTYDTLLMNTKGGALYTVRIPVTTAMKTTVTKVRTSTWQGFERLLAERCGQHGTLLLGIDKDSGAGYLYAVGQAAGANTVINAIGKVPATFQSTADFRALWLDSLPLVGD
ncbi:hypothetical protein AB0E69_37800 [Kribbella sp. NPDC026611]|uniref:hypothetical protein n=1 Tax=Kribbella sp. NPDC026611 TaxID=3154911 RepID=UPI003411726D